MIRWDWPKLKTELTALSSSLKLQMHLDAPDHAPCTQTTIDLAITEYEHLEKRIEAQTEVFAKVVGERNELREDLDKALQYLREGKAKFRPHTTNSLVDDLLEKYPRVT